MTSRQIKTDTIIFALYKIKIYFFYLNEQSYYNLSLFNTKILYCLSNNFYVDLKSANYFDFIKCKNYGVCFYLSRSHFSNLKLLKLINDFLILC